MPIETRYDEARGILYATVYGDFDLEEIEQGLAGLAAAGIPPGAPALWDLTGLDFHVMDNTRLAHMIEIRARHPERGQARLALLVQGELQYRGLAHVRDALREPGAAPAHAGVLRPGGGGALAGRLKPVGGRPRGAVQKQRSRPRTALPIRCRTRNESVYQQPETRRA
jgi:hypothetical protein